MRAQTKGLWRLAFGFTISAALGLLIGGVLYLALAYFLPSLTWRATWIAWAVGLLVALGGASSYFDHWRAVRRDTEAITRYLEEQAQRPREKP
jgi:hypothetical protein